jgi:O-antigen biosynthesis protein WbqP
MLKRLFDVFVSGAALILLAPVMLLIAAAVRIDSSGPALHWSQRFGRDGRLFVMPKFRTMRLGTPQLPTHLMEDGASRVTGIGSFLRRSSLDELPQLWSVLIGDMSLVGPRPALFNQQDLMEMRHAAGAAQLRPGITGWAQINGRDSLQMQEKVNYDAEYAARQNFVFDLMILFLTLLRVTRREDVIH